MEDITNADYAHVKRVCKDFEIKNLGYNVMLKLMHDCSLMYLTTFEICSLKDADFVLLIFFLQVKIKNHHTLSTGK